MNSNDNQDDFVKPNKIAQLVVVGIFILGVFALLILEPFINSLQPHDGASIKEIEKSIETFDGLINLLLSIAVLHSIAMSLYFYNLAYKIKKSGRYPPPNFVVIRKMKIRRGIKARNSVWFSYLFAILSWLPALFIIYLKWLLTINIT